MELLGVGAPLGVGVVEAVPDAEGDTVCVNVTELEDVEVLEGVWVALRVAVPD